LKALRKRNSSLTPLLLKREGAAYHSSNINAKNASATAIRKQLLKEHPTASSMEFLKDAIPPSAFPILSSYCMEYPPVTENDFSSILGYLLLSGAVDPLADYGDSNPDIASRLWKNRHVFRDFTSFCQQVKSRDITYTRISRILTHVLLSITKEDYIQAKSLDYIPYLRILGFRKDSVPLLSSIKKSASVPLLSKLADADTLLSAKELRMLEQDIFAGDLYRQVRTTVSGKGSSCSEYSQPIVIL
jgi:predicted nucleotidyltransferase